MKHLLVVFALIICSANFSYADEPTPINKLCKDGVTPPEKKTIECNYERNDERAPKSKPGTPYKKDGQWCVKCTTTCYYDRTGEVPEDCAEGIDGKPPCKPIVRSETIELCDASYGSGLAAQNGCKATDSSGICGQNDNFPGGEQKAMCCPKITITPVDDPDGF